MKLQGVFMTQGLSEKLSITSNSVVEDKTTPLEYKSNKELLMLIDKAVDRFSFRGDGKWQSISETDRKKMKLSKASVQDYYYWRRIALALKELINADSAIIS
tara:strand:- start:112 stop:417 length:306 start_codon:yes stop_codon:yes gene_type:complete